MASKSRSIAATKPEPEIAPADPVIEAGAAPAAPVVPAARMVQVGDRILIHAPNPINGMLENLGTVRRLNVDGTIAASISTGNDSRYLTSVAASAPADGSPWWEWAD